MRAVVVLRKFRSVLAVQPARSRAREVLSLERSMTGQIRHEALRLLLLETDRALVRIVSEQLSQSRHVTVTIEHATSLEQARATESHFDIIMTDLWLSDAFGFEVLDRLADRRCPIIVL